MTGTISFRADKDILQDISKVEKEWHADRSETIRRLLAEALRSWKIEGALDELKEHKISIGKAAKLCGLSLWELLDLVKQKNIDWTGYSKEDLERDLKALGGLS